MCIYMYIYDYYHILEKGASGEMMNKLIVLALPFVP